MSVIFCKERFRKNFELNQDLEIFKIFYLVYEESLRVLIAKIENLEGENIKKATFQKQNLETTNDQRNKPI